MGALPRGEKLRKGYDAFLLAERTSDEVFQPRFKVGGIGDFEKIKWNYDVLDYEVPDSISDEIFLRGVFFFYLL